MPAGEEVVRAGDIWAKKEASKSKKKKKDKKDKKAKKEKSSKKDKKSSSKKESRHSSDSEGGSSSPSSSDRGGRGRVDDRDSIDDAERELSDVEMGASQEREREIAKPAAKSQRDAWMLGGDQEDAGWALLTSGSKMIDPATGKKRDKPNPDTQPKAHERELNPSAYDKMTPNGLPSLEAKKGPSGGSGSIPAHLTVGDGGRRWRMKAMLRAQQTAAATGEDAKEVAAQRWDDSLIRGSRERDRGRDRDRSWRGEGGGRDWRRSEMENGKDWRRNEGEEDRAGGRERDRERGRDWRDTRRESEKDRERDGESFESQMAKLSERYETHPGEREREPQQSASSSSYSASASASSSAAAAVPMSVEEVGAEALSAMLAGNMDRYNQLNAKLIAMQNSDHIVPQEDRTGGGEKRKVEVLEDVDSAGRMRSMVAELEGKSTLSNSKKKRELTHEKGKNYYADDEISLEELRRREKVLGVQDYDQNLASYIVKKGTKFQELGEDEDEEYALGRFEKQSKKVDDKKREQYDARRAIRDKQNLTKNIDRCTFCPASERFTTAGRRDAMISESARVMLVAASMRDAIVEGQCLIFPKEHVCATTQMDENTYDEIRNYQKELAKMFDKKGLAPLFVETVSSIPSFETRHLNGGPHTAIEVFPIPVEQLDESRSFFKKALMEAESEWSQHKKLIPIKGKTGPRGHIPDNFPFFHVDFSLCDGFAHVIEDREDFSRNFGRETIQGVLGQVSLDRAFSDKRSYWTAVRKFREEFQPYDWPVMQQQRAQG
uniref:Cwf19-like C-terminal domain-containing protein n=1 Tax=Chromera velia CCMP2878 TaxID=1169474 RepID=A0A0G4GRL7_9ALVE|eukprot:Cvel_5095.t1-p1 / transcript=Cvel_5095.t1 / gene=Cvel_5095 / organism=Chromera_velia_CCMP2878 / gene_product=CWF19-like protein 2, putative / transcript_product=CWF19-like protein 2, putative / location=Cvel_scaffold233:6953-14988(-) / protein_length=775 / sequence_SO=supercontig / SO=protein_coding / is_pseudo=false